MANVLLDMEDWERALALFKENNACGLLDDQIGCLLALVKERREEGVPYLSMALLRAVTSLVRVCDGFANVFEARKDMKSAIDILQWKHSVLSGLRKKGTVSELDKISAASHAALARLLYDCRDLGGANDELKTAKALGAAYDAAPSHSARNVRFYEGVEHVGIYSDFGRRPPVIYHRPYPREVLHEIQRKPDVREHDELAPPVGRRPDRCCRRHHDVQHQLGGAPYFF